MFITRISKDIDEAVSFLKKGLPIAFPTETVYGLGANVFDEEAIKAIFIAKNRPSDNPLIVHIADLSWLPEIAIDIPEAFYTLAKHFMPGAITIVLKKHPQIPSIASAGLDTIGVRMPSHPAALGLLNRFGKPLAAPSANLSGRPSATSAFHVLEDFEGKIPFILDGGECLLGIESTVVLLEKTHAVLLRPGVITAEAIQDVLNMPVITPASGEAVRSPGMKYRHYAPKARVHLLHSEKELIPFKKNECLLIALKRPVIWQGAWELLDESSFYKALRLADEQGFSDILLLLDEKTLAKEGLMNRILKASF